MGREEFLDAVLEKVPRSTAGERREIAAELSAHMEDHARALEERGASPAEAAAGAVAAMGEPGEIGARLNAQLSPFWLWLGRGAKALCLVAALGILYSLLCRFCPSFGDWAARAMEWGAAA